MVTFIVLSHIGRSYTLLTSIFRECRSSATVTLHILQFSPLSLQPSTSKWVEWFTHLSPLFPVYTTLGDLMSALILKVKVQLWIHRKNTHFILTWVLHIKHNIIRFFIKSVVIPFSAKGNVLDHEVRYFLHSSHETSSWHWQNVFSLVKK